MRRSPALVYSVCSVSSVVSTSEFRMKPFAAIAVCLCLLVSVARAALATAPSAVFDSPAMVRLRLQLPAVAAGQLKAQPREYVRATVLEGSNVWNDVAVRLKGRTGSFRPVDDKPSLTLDFERFVPGQRFHGLARIHLNNSVEDPSLLHEWTGARLFREAGIPAARVAHAMVELNGRRLGVYVMKEGFTREFLAQHFARADGNLYEPEPGPGADVAGPMRRSLGSGDRDRADLGRLIDVASIPALDERWRRLGTVLDTNRFLTFLAMEVLAGHRDGYALARNNYRLYHDPETDRFVFIPGGMDNLFGRVKTALQPRMTGTIAAALMETPGGQAAYRERVRELFPRSFDVGDLTAAVRQRAAELERELPWRERRTLRREAEDLAERIELRVRTAGEQIEQWPK